MEKPDRASPFASTSHQGPAMHPQAPPVDLEAALRQMLKPVVVLSIGSRNFNLERGAVHAGEACAVGGFLCKRVSRKKWNQPHFYRLDVDGDSLCEMNHEQVMQRIVYSKIISVDIFKSSDDAPGDATPTREPGSPVAGRKGRAGSKDDASLCVPCYYFRIRYILHGEVQTAELKTIDSCDLKQTLQWVAALQLRAKVYNPGLDADRVKALKAIVWLQALYRGSRGRLLAQNLKLKQQSDQRGLSQQVRSLFSRQRLALQGGDSSDSSDEDEDENGIVEDGQLDVDRSATDDESATPARHSTPSAGALGLRRFSMIKKSPRSESVEDEMWENERWATMAIRGQQIYRGWSAAALLPTERAAFSDRTGRGSWESPSHMPVPNGWKIVEGWTVDKSGLANNLCDADGWAYNVTFFSLDSNWAAGRAHTMPSAQWLVRRRRWYRRRVPDPPLRDPLLSDEPSNVLVHGWIGMRGISTGRWQSLYALLPDALPGDDGKFGVPFSYFRPSIRVTDKQGLMSVPWDQLSGKHLKRKFLDNTCKVNDDLADHMRPGLFSLHLTGEAEPRMINAHSLQHRERWVKALRMVIAKSGPPRYGAIADRRSMRKGAAWELARATGMLKGAVQLPKSAKAADAALVRSNESETDLSFVARMREEAREERMRAASSDAQSESGGESNSIARKESRLRQIFAKSMPSFKRGVSIFGGGIGDTNADANSQPPQQALQGISEGRRDPGDAATARVPAPSSTMTSPSPSSAILASDMVFEQPAPYDNLILDVVLPLDVDDFDRFFFREDDFHNDLYAMQGMSEVEVTPWTNGSNPGSESRKSMRAPRDGIVPPTQVFHLYTYQQAVKGRGYVVDQVTNTPDVPFGSSISTNLRYVFFNDGAQGCRLIISHRVTFRKTTMAQSFIKSSTKREITNFYRNKWFLFLKKWLAANRSNLLKGQGFGAEVIAEELSAAAEVQEKAAGETTSVARANVPLFLVAGLVIALFALLVVLLLRVLWVLYDLEARLQVVEASLLASKSRSFV